MAKKTRSKPAPMKQSEQVYSRRGPTNPRTLGSTANHDHPTIPSSTFRTLEQSISRDQLRTHEEYRGYNPRTGKSKFVAVPDDVLVHAQQSITDAKFRPVTDGYRQRYRQEESKRDDRSKNNGMDVCCSSPSVLGGSMGGRRRKDRY